MFNHVQSVLSFSAFRPEPDDSQYAWKARFGGRKTALVHLGRASLSFLPIGAKGQIAAGQSARGDLKEIFAELGPSIEEATDGGWCLVSLDSRYVISLETNLSRKKGSEEALKTDPRSVLHARFERGKKYAVTHNPESNSSLLLSYDEEFLKKSEAMCKEQGLKIGRLFCGAYVLLRHALGATNTKRGPEAAASALYLICCKGSVCVLSQEKDNWVELRSRPDVYDETDLQPLLDLVAPFNERMSPGTGLVVVCDEPIEGLADKLAGAFPGRPINDLTKPHLLADLAYRN